MTTVRLVEGLAPGIPALASTKWVRQGSARERVDQMRATINACIIIVLIGKLTASLGASGGDTPGGRDG